MEVQNHAVRYEECKRCKDYERPKECRENRPA